MKLLFDQNLSPKLVTHLNDLYPNSTHALYIGLDTAADPLIWDYARDNTISLYQRIQTSVIKA